MHRNDIVALGEPLVEFNQTRGEDARAWRQGFGGDTSNMAIAAARLGARVAYVTRVGDDAFGRMFRALWSAEGVAVDGVATDTDAPTGVYFVTHAASGHAFSYLRAGSAASRLAPGNLPVDLIRAARALHVSGISQAISTSACDAVFAAIAAARDAGARVYYDPNLRPKLWPRERACAVALATIGASFSAVADATNVWSYELVPALKDRAKVMPPLRGEGPGTAPALRDKTLGW